MELVTKGDGISIQVGLTSRAAVGVTLCSLLPGGSHHCSAVSLDSFSSVEGFSEYTAPSGLTFGVHSYWR